MPLSVKLQNDTIVVDGRFEITFRRTIKVPDNHQTSHLPPDMGKMSLINVNSVASKLPPEMAQKGGLMLTMHENEAMWINFHVKGGWLDVRRHYAVKIFAGGINVVSGEPENENTATTLRRRTLSAKKESIQDYMVVPGQKWIDGIAVSSGKVRQFVATPLGNGLTIEGQLTKEEVVGGLQFEIIGTTPRPKVPRTSGPNGSGEIHVKDLTGRTIVLNNVEFDWKIDVIKEILAERLDYPPEDLRLIFGGKQLEDGRTIFDYNIPTQSLLHLVLRLRGGGPDPDARPDAQGSEMGVAAGGLIKQSIVPDGIDSLQMVAPPNVKNDPNRFRWDKDDILVFNVQMLNATDYHRVTNRVAPATPLSARLYAANGGNFFDFGEEEGGVSGDFSGVQSVGQLTGKLDDNLHITSKKLPSFLLGGKKNKKASNLSGYETSAAEKASTPSNYSETSSVARGSYAYTENSNPNSGYTENSSPAPSSNHLESTVSVNQSHLEQIMAMGFPKAQATKALWVTGGFDTAVNWLLVNPEGQPTGLSNTSTINSGPNHSYTENSSPAVLTSHAGSTAGINPTYLAHIMGLGVSKAEAVKALRATRTVEEAADWLFTPPAKRPTGPLYPLANSSFNIGSVKPVDPGLVAALTAMGFSESQARKGIRATGALAPGLAIEWILDHPVEQETESVAAPKVSGPAFAPEGIVYPLVDRVVDPSVITTVQPRRSQFRTLEDLENSIKRVNVGTF
ncbi:hypothetical protein H072_675 [Dactylellina haptotyla CBS 200.50]|uniref:Ubiquitin-like domain-containing protein n=1 Tax=Dactylellina haptotyla (strain CBS 200.50) TaxID=1284197 RepID=S8AQS7_DACHA|nr:hypothetical protein H072_675 [Dactylellina haptotyla CBS 200.50]